MRGRTYVNKTVHPADVEEYTAQGWLIEKKSKRSVRLRRPKDCGPLLEDRVWSLLYRLGFTYLSGHGGAKLAVDLKKPDGPQSQIDAVAIDDEVALAIECKSAEKLGKRPQFQEELGKFALLRERFVNAIPREATGHKVQSALAMFTSNIVLSENDKVRAKEANIVVFDEHDLKYYEDLVSHLGPAAKYQFLADLLPGKSIPGLRMRIPAIKSKMGGHACYTFSISPEYLLKIAYVSHRAKGKASDINTYQRMISRSRLIKIRRYIEDDGIFPTNIVVNFDKRYTFERGSQESSDQDSGIIGWLDIRPTYKSAWIIDGQHRLFAYSGHSRAKAARLSVLAFEGLQPSRQAELFRDINAQQKHVKQSLLQEMYAELSWNSDKPAERVSAVISKSIQTLNADPESPFFQRILGADDKRDFKCCISLNSVFRALEQPDFYLPPSKKEGIPEFGPLWAADSNAILKRTVYLLNGWFRIIEGAVPRWWDAGSTKGEGGLAMNDGVVACIQVLRSVFQHLSKQGERLATLDDRELMNRVAPYAEELGKYLASLSATERQSFRDLRGAQGQTTRTRRLQQAIHAQVPDFDPQGLQEFMATEKAQTNTRAKEAADDIEVMLQRAVIDELKTEYGVEDENWWMMGVPKNTRLKVVQRYEDDDGKRGGREYYFDLIDYRTIIVNNWELLGPIFAYNAAGGGKEKRTNWISEVNSVRQIVAHASSGRTVPTEQLTLIEGYRSWLRQQIESDEDQDDATAV